MRIALISACDPADVVLIRSLQSSWPDTFVLRPVGPPRRLDSSAGSIATSALAAPGELVRHLIRSGYYWARPRQLDWRVSRRLFGWYSTPALPDHRPVEFDEVNGPRGSRLLRAAAPDVLVLSGAPILRAPVLEVPRLATVNVHLGIAPEYRGSHTLFQALRRGDYDHVGVTVHHVDAAVDAGPLLARLYPPLHPADTSATIRAKCALMAAELLVELLTTVEAMGHAPPGVPQPQQGHTFRERDRAIRDDLQYLGRRIRGLRPPQRPGRVIRYYTPVAGTIQRTERPR